MELRGLDILLTMENIERLASGLAVWRTNAFLEARIRIVPEQHKPSGIPGFAASYKKRAKVEEPVTSDEPPLYTITVRVHPDKQRAGLGLIQLLHHQPKVYFPHDINTWDYARLKRLTASEVHQDSSDK